MKKLFFIIVVFYSASCHGQQILQYSNYLENSFYLNPAVAHLGKKSLNIIYRNQWVGFEGAPKTTFLSYQSSFSHKKDVKSSSFSNVGGFLQNENIGAFRSFKINISYSYSFLLSSNWRLSFGSFIGIQQLALDVTGVTLFDPNDPVVDVSNFSLLPDFSMGFALSNNNNFFGFSAKQVFQNKWTKIINSDQSQNESSIVLIAAKKIVLSNIGFTPNIMLDFTGQFKPKLIAGLKIDYKQVVSSGIAIRNENSILGQFKIMFNKNLQITYAHDFYFSNILLGPLSSSEFMVSYVSSIRENNKHKNTISFF
ncbi:MAG: PorP/SprF family type IX secretion system membrane protein [Flavobacteriales bacterium]|nr:PorP/SprF family type IX secretion system membrane protein [Flavobacteriales bacterium]